MTGIHITPSNVYKRLSLCNMTVLVEYRHPYHTTTHVHNLRLSLCDEHNIIALKKPNEPNNAKSRGHLLQSMRLVLVGGVLVANIQHDESVLDLIFSVLPSHLLHSQGRAGPGQRLT